MLLQHGVLQLIVGLFLFASGIIAVGDVASDQSQELRYGDLARLTYPMFDEMVEGVRSFDKATLPHEAKTLRRLIGDVWYHLEIFAYAYSTREDDLLPGLLVSLRRGYDRMGDFKDLFDRQSPGSAKSQPVTYDEFEVKRVREPVLKWRREILEPAKLQAYRRYLRSSSNEYIFMRPKFPLSTCYWGGVAEVPSHDRTGFQNLRVLMIALVEKLQREYEQIEDIRGPLEEQHLDVLHDFRVHIRCVLLMVRYFPPLTADIAGAGPIEHRLEDLVAKYGGFNDMIMAFNTANSKRQTWRAETLARSISAQWSAIQKWQRKTRLDNQLEDYGNRLRLAEQQNK